MSALNFSYAPVPRRALKAVRERRLDSNDLAIIAFLYDRADLGALAKRRSTPRVTLAQIAAGIRWTATPDALSRRLRRLAHRPEAWFTYQVADGRGTYVFTLHPDAPESSEPGPTSMRGARPTSGSTQARSTTPNPEIDGADLSELADATPSGTCPTSHAFCPTSRSAATDAGKPLTGNSSRSAVRAPQSAQRTQDLSVKGAREDDGELRRLPRDLPVAPAPVEEPSA